MRGSHAVDEVGPVERPDEHLRVTQGELRDDVLAHPAGGGGGERVQGRAGEVVPEPRELSVLGAELVPPLADAMRLVDRDEADAPRPEPRPERLAALPDEALRRDVQQPAAPLVEVGVDLAPFGRGDGGVEGGGRHPVLHQAVHLVLHQRYER